MELKGPDVGKPLLQPAAFPNVKNTSSSFFQKKGTPFQKRSVVPLYPAFFSFFSPNQLPRRSVVPLFRRSVVLSQKNPTN
jgi:hypothetical protein